MANGSGGRGRAPQVVPARVLRNMEGMEGSGVQAARPLKAALSTLTCHVEQLHAALDALEQRVSSVLRPSNPQPASIGQGATTTDGPASDTVLELRGLAVRVERAVARVMDLHDCCEA